MSDPRRFIPKAEALHARYTSMQSPGASYMDPLFAQQLADAWAPIRDEWRAKIDLLNDLPIRGPFKVKPGSDFEGRGLVMIGDVRAILGDIGYALSIVTHPMVAMAPFSLEREGLFLSGQAFDAMRSISEIIKAAQKSIMIVDGYIGETTLSVCSAKQPGVTVDVLTFDGPGAKKSTDASMRAHAQAFNKQYGGLSIRTSNAFHDRFIVIDGSEYFHVGSSIKDAGSRGFMFSRLEEPTIIAALSAALTKEWTGAAKFEPP